jgi:hypothetical protein
VPSEYGQHYLLFKSVHILKSPQKMIKFYSFVQTERWTSPFKIFSVISVKLQYLAATFMFEKIQDFTLWGTFLKSFFKQNRKPYLNITWSTN